MYTNSRRITFLFTVLVVLFVVCSCHNSQKTIVKSLEDIKHRNIKDQRLNYWNIELERQKSGFILKGNVMSETGYLELRKLANSKQINFRVELLPIGDYKINKWGIVTLSVCNIRSKPAHSAELLTQALLGTPVKIVAKKQGWFLIQTPDRYFGWVDAGGVVPKSNLEIAEWKRLEKVIYAEQAGFAFTRADQNSRVYCDLVLANLLSITGTEKGYYQILLPNGEKAFVKKEECSSLDMWKAKEIDAEKVCTTAMEFMGTPYIWGGTSAKMVDCSGFTKTVFYFNGILLQRDASQQTLYGELVETKKGFLELVPGDLLFFGQKASNSGAEKVSHVGLYIGDSEFIHASGKVRINSLDKKRVNYTEVYTASFIRARRIINSIDGVGVEWIQENEFYKEILPQ